MAIILPSGFNITNSDPVDARISVADASARLGFSAANVYEGLTVYQQDTNEIYVLVNAATPSSTSSWQLLGSNLTGSFATTGSNTFIGNQTITGSLRVSAGITGSLEGTASYSTSSSYSIQSISSSYSLSSSLAQTASFIATASWASNSVTASYVRNAVSASYSSTASYTPNYLPLSGGTITGNLIINGTASISYLNVNYETASIIYSSGSNQFGDATNDTQTLIGTIKVSGSQQVTGSLNVTAGITGSLQGTSSWANNAISSSYALTASYVITAQTASYVLQAVSASYASSSTSASYASSSTSASYALTSSYVLQAVSSSFASTASYFTGTVISSSYASSSTSASYAATASLPLRGIITASANNTTITFTKGDGTVFDVTVSQSGSVATASYALFAEQARSSSYAATASVLLGSVVSSSYALSSSYSLSSSYAVSASIAQTASYVLNAVSASFSTLSQTSNTASYVVTAQTASFVATAQTASYVLNAVSASRATSAANADTASYILNAVSSSYALSSSFAISSSLAQTASFVTLAQTASYILNAVSASRSISSANADTASFVTLAQTASYVQNAISASYIVTAQTASYVLNAISSSFATSASYALKAVSASIATRAAASDTADKADQIRITGDVNSLLYFPLIPSSSVGYQQVTTIPNISYDTDNNILIAESFQGNLEGTANVALSALTASYVDTLNQNVLISGSLTVGSGSSGPFENTLTLGARDSVSEGGQLGFNAPGGTYTSASFIDLYQNRLRILKGTNSTSTGEVANWSMYNLQMALPAYNSVGAFPGTVAGLLAFDSSGNIITAATSSGGGSTSPGGSNTQIQYNNGSAFGGVSTLTFDGTTLRATGSFTGSLTGELVGTASWASNAVTASYVLNAVSSSFARSSSFATSASYASVTLANVLATGNTTNNQVITSNNASSSISVNDNYIDIVRDDRNILISDTAIVITEGTFGSSIELLEGDALVNFTGRFAANGEDVITSSSLNTALATKQNTLTLTTTGTSGAATLVSGTLNIPQYTGGGGAAFPYTGDASISGSLTVTGSLIVSGSSLKIDIPSKANGYVLTSDASGNATWAASSGGSSTSAPAIRKAQPRITRETYY